MFARLRADGPVSWQPDPTADGFTSGPGYWAVVRHADVVEVSTDPVRFSSEPTTSIRDLPPELGAYFGFMLNMDDPRHAALRRIVSLGFTPRRLDQTRALAARVAEAAVGAACDEGRCDGVDAIAAPVPLTVICELMGIPAADRAAIAEHGQTLTVARDSASMMTAAGAIHDIAAGLAEDRQRRPGDDLTSALVEANVDGARLTPAEVGSFFMLLVVAGTQTTRHAISHGLVALAEHPDQRALWRDDPGLTPTAVDEILRWATPVRHFRRTATVDCTIGDATRHPGTGGERGTRIRAGDKVVLWYSSANRDEAVFDRPDRFDVCRTPNPHVAFGAGPHFCLGAALARHEIAAVFTHLLRRSPDWAVERVTPIESTFVDGHDEVICDFR